VPGYAGRTALRTHVPGLGALEVLLGVARVGSLNSAAQQIDVSQQAVSAPACARGAPPSPSAGRGLYRERNGQVRWHYHPQPLPSQPGGLPGLAHILRTRPQRQIAQWYREPPRGQLGGDLRNGVLDEWQHERVEVPGRARQIEHADQLPVGIGNRAGRARHRAQSIGESLAARVGGAPMLCCCGGQL